MAETRTVHLDLSRLAEWSIDSDLIFRVSGREFSVAPHDDQSLARAASENAALALIDESRRADFTHHVRLPNELFQHDHVYYYHICIMVDGFPIPLPIQMGVIHPNRAHHPVHIHRHDDGFCHPTLALYGVDRLAPDEVEHVSYKAMDLKSWVETASTIVGLHPHLASADSAVNQRIHGNHIYPSIGPQRGRIQTLAQDMIRQGRPDGKRGWLSFRQAFDPSGKQLTWTVQPPYEGGKIGDPVWVYSLSQATLDALPESLRSPLLTTKDDEGLQGRIWAVSGGRGAQVQTGGESSQSSVQRDRKDAGPDYVWKTNHNTRHYGTKLHEKSIRLVPNEDSDKAPTLHFKLDNKYLRTLGVYVSFHSMDTDDQIVPDDWDDRLAFMLPDVNLERNKYKKFLTLVPAVSTVLGVPISPDDIEVAFPLPNDVDYVRVHIGSLGVGTFESDVCIVGTVFTGIFQFALPIAMLVTGGVVTGTKWYTEMIEKDWQSAMKALSAVFGFFVGLGLGIDGVLGLQDLKTIGLQLADAAVTFVLGSVIPTLLSKFVPFLSIGLQIFGASVSLVELSHAVADVTRSPFASHFKVSRSFDLQLQISPDPRHGEPGRPETAVWPAVAKWYRAVVMYRGGASYKVEGVLSATTSSTPIASTFHLPAAGDLRIQLSVFSDNGWLCGKWSHGWMPARPPENSSTRVITGSIEEILVPLTRDTRYVYKERIGFDAQREKHVWTTTGPSVATPNEARDSNTAPSVSEQVALTINEVGFQIGYTWKSSHTGLSPCSQSGPANTTQLYITQNLSVLADPESRLKVSGCGDLGRPMIAYDHFGRDADGGISRTNYRLVSDGKRMDLLPVDLRSEANAISSDSATSLGFFPLDAVDAMVVHPNGSVIAASWSRHEMYLLEPAQALVPREHAPRALPIAGLGVRQGLTRGPRALAVTPDGAILVLETGNRRVQAFDALGNPAPSFVGEELFRRSGDRLAEQLDAGQWPEILADGLRSTGTTKAFVAQDTGLFPDKLRDIVALFAKHGYKLSFDEDAPAAATRIEVMEPGRRFRVFDPTFQQVFVVNRADGELSVFREPFDAEVETVVKGESWVYRDDATAQAYRVARTEQQFVVSPYTSHFSLQGPNDDAQAEVRYLDVAVEVRGFIYVLSCHGDGTDPKQYFLDVYRSDGSHLFRTPDGSEGQHIVAERLALDAWRNLYTLDYEWYAGPKGRPEPFIGHWIPTPPRFDLDVSARSAFEGNDRDRIAKLFADHGIGLRSWNMTTMEASGFWRIENGDHGTYDVIRTATRLEVYDTAKAGTP